ncbi:MAG: hypothetical protein HYY05_07420, partial [Chloroflexi bacterium]|nr:hypothetical protein [Chloroflexota bacterium]
MRAFAEAIDRLCQPLTEIAIERLLIRQAGDFADQMRLRAYDAVHLAALRLLGELDQVTFACWDADLRAAARQFGDTLIPHRPASLSPQPRGPRAGWRGVA